jgi:hypothetical protein
MNVPSINVEKVPYVAVTMKWYLSGGRLSVAKFKTTVSLHDASVGD